MRKSIPWVVVIASLAGCGGCAKKDVAPDRSSVEADPPAVPANGVEVATIRVTLRASDLAAVPGRAVTVDATGSDNVVAPKSATTGTDGVATFTLASTRAEEKTIRATVDGAGVLPQAAAVTFVAGPAARIAFRVPPSTVPAGAVIAPAVKVAALDSAGNVAIGTAVTVDVRLGINPGGSALAGKTSAAAQAGIAEFADLRIDGVGTGYTLIASAPSLGEATSAAFDVTAGTPDRLVFEVPPANAVAGAAIAPPVRVALKDVGGNTLDRTDAVTLAVASGPAGATLSGTPSAAAVAGVATFSDLRLERAGDYTLVATATGFAGATSAAFTVTGAAAMGLAFARQPANLSVRRTFDVEVEVRDAFGNRTAGPDVTIALQGGAAGAVLAGTTTAIPQAGVATFAGLSVAAEATGYRIVASAAGLSGATSVAFDVVDDVGPAVPTDLAVAATTATALTATWTAVGDDGTQGNATGHELHYSTSPITTANFGSATPVTLSPPKPSGSAESVTIPGLNANTTYHVALRVTDNASNASFGIASGATLPCPRGYVGATCNQCDVGFRTTGPGVCEDYCTNPDPCNPPPASVCGGATGQTAIQYPNPRGCTSTTTTPFYQCEAATQTDCSASGDVCLDGACQAASVPAAGDLLITEIHHKPTGGASDEWFEVKNLTTRLLNLAGVNVEAVGGASFTLPASLPVLVRPGALFVFGADANAATNGGATVDAAWGTLNPSFTIAGPRRLRLTAGATVLEDLDAAAVTPAVATGTAVNLSSLALGKGTNQRAWYWCAATASMLGGDKGTPDAVNDACGMTVTPPVNFCVLQWPLDAGVIDAPDTVRVYGQFYEPSVTDRNPDGNDFYPNLVAELGHGPKPTAGQPDPTTWTWVSAGYNPLYVDSDPNNDRDEVMADLAIGTAGEHLYGWRFALRDPATGVVSPAVHCDRAGVANPPASGNYGTATVYAPSSQITTARSTADGTGLSLPISGARVTYVRSLIGSDAAGFFVQGQKTGPALFVAVNPATLTPIPAPGDRVTLTVTAMGTANTLRQATAISGYARISQSNPLTGLVQDVSTAADLVSSLGNYESELVTVSGTIASAFAAAGSVFVSATLDTAAITGNANLKLRLPQTIKDNLDLAPQCAVKISNTPLWRFNAQAQPSAWVAADLAVQSCPAPKVLGAAASDFTQVLVSFDRNLDAVSVLANGSQFTISPALAVTAASVSGAQLVTLTTATQTTATSYTLTVALSVKDTYGTGVAAPGNTATFSGFSGVCTPSQVVISQVYGGGGNAGATYTNDFVELHNRSKGPASVGGWSIQYASAIGTTWTVLSIPVALVLPAGGYYLIQLASGGAVGSALPTPDQSSALINMAVANGKVALVDDAVALTGACPTALSIVDLVGYGTANCSEGTPTAALSSTTAALRSAAGCIDTDANATDLSIATPAPRNSATTAAHCNCN